MSTAVANPKAPQVVNVPIDLVVPSDHQPRFMANPQAMAELIDSIRARGIRVPLLGRPHPKFAGTKPEMVELASGHRRLAAARQLDLGEVPMIVQPMDDREFIELMVLENADRQNLYPLEEGRAIAELRRVGWSIEEIAARFGRSPTWVARRSALNDLIEPIRELVQQPRVNTIGFDWCDLSPLVLESLARLPAETQLRWLEEECEWDGRDSVSTPPWSAEEPKRFNDSLNRDWLHRLSAAPWQLDDGELLPEAGPCSECPKRSSCQGLLFADLHEAKKPADHCLDAACWARKQERIVKARLQQARAEHGKVELINKAPMNCAEFERVEQTYKDFGKPQPDHVFEKVKKGEKGAVPAVVVAGPGAGSVSWVRKVAAGRQRAGGKAAGLSRGSDHGDKPRGAPSLKEKRGALERRRAAYIVDRWGEQLDTLIAGKDPISLALDWRDNLLDLLAVFGTHEHRDIQARGDWAKVEKIAQNGDAEQALLRSLLIVWKARLNYFTQSDIDRFLDEADAQAEVLGLDLNAYRDQAVKELPEPKSWAKEAVSDQQSAVSKRKNKKAPKKAES